MTEKEIFIENFKKRTRKFAVEIISDAELSTNLSELIRLQKEANEITKIMSKSKDSTYKNIGK